jgi:hypothetical protein
MTDPFVTLENPAPDSIPEGLLDFVAWLGGPAFIELTGQKSGTGQRRAVVTLLHGNEPSGVFAIHQLLRRGFVPAVDTLFAIVSVDTALERPGFANRFLPGDPVATRCCREPGAGKVGKRAHVLLERLFNWAPEALLDLHNNTGHNPAYGVAVQTNGAVKRLTSYFADKLMFTALRLGTITEATAAQFPSVTIECGLAGDPAADAHTARCLEAFLAVPSLELDAPPCVPLVTLTTSLRVHLRPGVALTYADAPPQGEPLEPGLVLRRDLDRHNFEVLPKGTLLGWQVGAPVASALYALGPDGEEHNRELFEIRGSALHTTTEMIPIMMTTDPKIAAQDCVFYTAEVETR